MARTIKRAYARYTAEFKAEAVRLASQPGILVQPVAQSLYIHPSCCHDGRNNVVKV